MQRERFNYFPRSHWWNRRSRAVDDFDWRRNLRLPFCDGARPFVPRWLPRVFRQQNPAAHIYTNVGARVAARVARIKSRLLLLLAACLPAQWPIPIIENKKTLFIYMQCTGKIDSASQQVCAYLWPDLVAALSVLRGNLKAGHVQRKQIIFCRFNPNSYRLVHRSIFVYVALLHHDSNKNPKNCIFPSREIHSRL